MEMVQIRSLGSQQALSRAALACPGGYLCVTAGELLWRKTTKLSGNSKH